MSQQPSESSLGPVWSGSLVGERTSAPRSGLVANAKSCFEEAQRAAASVASVPSPLRQTSRGSSQGQTEVAEMGVGQVSVRSSMAKFEIRPEQYQAQRQARRDELMVAVDRAAAKAAKQGVQVSQAMREAAADHAGPDNPEEQTLRSMLADAAAQAAVLEAEAAGELDAEARQWREARPFMTAKEWHYKEMFETARLAALRTKDLDYNAMFEKAARTFERRRERAFVATVSSYRRVGIELELHLCTMSGASFEVRVQSGSRVADLAEEIRQLRCPSDGKVSVKLIGPKGTILEPFRRLPDAVDYELDDSGTKGIVDVLHVKARAYRIENEGLDGEYVRVPDLVQNGAPVYKRGGRREVYFYKGQDDRWFLSGSGAWARDYCAGAWIYHPDEAGGRLPHVLPAEKWRARVDGAWRSDPAISVKEASTLQVSKPRAPHEDKGGDYVLLPSMFRNGAPVFKHANLEWYFYKGTDDRWVIGGPEEKAKDFACTSGDIQHLEQACGRLPSGLPVGRWHTHIGVWRAEPEIKVVVSNADDGLYYPLSTLQGCTDRAEWRRLGLPGPTRWKYLPDWEFVELFGMSKESFEKLPAWKQKPLKQKHDLF